MKQEFDTLIVVTPKDYRRLEKHYHRLAEYLPVRRVLFIGNDEVGRLVESSDLGDKADFINENDIIPFQTVHEAAKEVLKDLLMGQELPRGITGWYYQQFLKMQYSHVCKDAYYMVWDGDTVPCRAISMFHEESGVPWFDLKKEYHEEYFKTLSRLLPGMRKCIEKSFISEHMLIKCDIMKNLIADILGNASIEGTTFFEKIFHAIDISELQSNSFSEFETYGTYVAFKYPTEYRLRNWHSFRYGGEFFDPDRISDSDFEWLGKDFDAISFEKGHFVREDHKNLFDNRKYQEKLTARQMLEIAQEEFKEGSYLEVWD